jgi:hypothetical protein
MKRHPNNLTAHFACGGSLNGTEADWVENELAELRELEPGSFKPECGSALVQLKNIYMGARLIQGSIVAARLALPAAVAAGQAARDAFLPDDFRDFAERGSAETERFLSGSENGAPRPGNDYPETIKKYISTFAGLFELPYGRAYENLKEGRSDLLALGQDADELQRLSWAHIRWIIDEVMSAEEVAGYRKKPLREGTDELLAVIRERTGVSLPARIMQRDDWLAALESPRQETHLALFNDMRFFVENAEVALLYCVGSLLARIRLGKASEDALQDLSHPLIFHTTANV